MANHIENIDIVHFRGIHSLAIDNLNHINIIAGDNNSGKTSVLAVSYTHLTLPTILRV